MAASVEISSRSRGWGALWNSSNLWKSLVSVVRACVFEREGERERGATMMREKGGVGVGGKKWKLHEHLWMLTYTLLNCFAYFEKKVLFWSIKEKDILSDNELSHEEKHLQCYLCLYLVDSKGWQTLETPQVWEKYSFNRKRNMKLWLIFFPLSVFLFSSTHFSFSLLSFSLSLNVSGLPISVISVPTSLTGLALGKFFFLQCCQVSC